MKHFWALTRIRMRIAARNKTFLFFSLIMPLLFFFLAAGIFVKGDPQWVAYAMAPVLSLTVMGSFWGLSASLVMFREQGILRRFRLAPVTAADMLASSIVANYFLMLPAIVIELALARTLFHVSQFGNLVSLAVLITVGTVSFASLGLIIASVTNTMQETQVICQIIWFALIFFSGATLPLPRLPGMVRDLSVFLPATYLVHGLLKAMRQSQSVWHLRTEIIALAAWAVLAFFVSTRLFRWEAEEKVSRNAKLWAAATILPFLVLGAWESKYGQIQDEAKSIYLSVGEQAAPVTPPRAQP